MDTEGRELKSDEEKQEIIKSTFTKKLLIKRRRNYVVTYPITLTTNNGLQYLHYSFTSTIREIYMFRITVTNYERNCQLNWVWINNFYYDNNLNFFSKIISKVLCISTHCELLSARLRHLTHTLDTHLVSRWIQLPLSLFQEDRVSHCKHLNDW